MAIFGLSRDGAGAEARAHGGGRARRVGDAYVWGKFGRTRTLGRRTPFSRLRRGALEACLDDFRHYRGTEPAPRRVLTAAAEPDASETRPSGVNSGGRVLWGVQRRFGGFDVGPWRRGYACGGRLFVIFVTRGPGPGRGRAGRVEDAFVGLRSGRTRTLGVGRRLGGLSVGSGGVYLGDFSSRTGA